ncbi:pyridoxamine 5'-phosphate oxidase family protein [Natrinema gelatinilyticum]|uniref:pyridoxamine 5'-phosphate oxidase family protein n=1 Tax=Natrinema gelatinilyticum TaxID=2961571 RepID=UPI0020C4E41A|nr:pyridoxamine 5'-phosphate oxidase family protein [Natrinema gelatinilyticum]
MQGLRWLQMTEEEIGEFLGRGGTGVISFTPEPGDPPVSIPVSYGFNEEEQLFYYQLSFPRGSGKGELIDKPVSFVVFDQIDGMWQSVIATGTLDDLEDMPYESATIQGMWAIQIPRVDIFERPREEVTFRFYSLDPDKLTGRKEVPSRP